MGTLELPALGRSEFSAAGSAGRPPKLSHMKKALKLVSLAAFVAGILWALRDQLLPGPTQPTAHPPAFRNAPPPTQKKGNPLPAAQSANRDDLTTVNGIGPVYAKRLTDAGVATFDALATSDAADLAARANLPIDRVSDWIDKAGELA